MPNLFRHLNNSKNETLKPASQRGEQVQGDNERKVQHDNMKKLKIIFFGSSSYVIPIIKSLNEKFDLVLVLTTEKYPTDAVPTFCLSQKINYKSVSTLSGPTINHELLSIKPVVGILADFGLIIPKEILNTFPKGILNIHPSLLPKYRGPTPVQTAILEGTKTTGVTIIRLDELVDHGPILGQEKESILPSDTAESLYKRLFEKGANLLLKVIDIYLEGKLIPVAQNHEKVTFTKPLTRQSGFINISNGVTAVVKIESMIRAYYPWPGVWFKTKLSGKGKIIKLLPHQKLQVEGKRPISYKDFLNGYPDFGRNLLERLGFTQ